MTREEALRKAKGYLTDCLPADCYGEVEEIIEALEEESVLDKIRAEIEEQKKERCFDNDDMFVYRTGLDDALYIIDKYKESEKHKTGREE